MLNLSPKDAFDRFVHDLNAWWPREYTWSRDKLQNISIEAREDGLCTEMGPNGFRCDWGRVVSIEAPERIILKWQISPRREPVPDPSQASEVEIRFKSKEGNQTEIEFEHRDFDKHGEGSAAYQQAMASEMGWDHILDLYVNYAEQKS
jgi:uncharacterized protein YndB with AHSA1/START domain